MSAALERVRVLCMALPEVVEEQAWVGTRWTIRKKNFAHVVDIVDGHPPAYAEAASATDATVLTFRSSPSELDALANAGPPFFKPVWFTDIVGLVLDDRTDWSEVAELVTESYRILAPNRLRTLLDD
ncbi:MAG: hypothetical protein JWN67_2501 [Actinomycetia bacterium]|nr:hypothetical protein [Actinomycetes bacterium]